MILMYLSKRLWRAAISAILGYVYISRGVVRYRRYTLTGMDYTCIPIPLHVLYLYPYWYAVPKFSDTPILWLRKFYKKWLIRIFVDRDFLVDKVFHRVVDKAVFVDEVFY